MPDELIRTLTVVRLPPRRTRLPEVFLGGAPLIPVLRIPARPTPVEEATAAVADAEKAVMAPGLPEDITGPAAAFLSASGRLLARPAHVTPQGMGLVTRAALMVAAQLPAYLAVPAALRCNMPGPDGVTPHTCLHRRLTALAAEATRHAAEADAAAALALLDEGAWVDDLGIGQEPSPITRAVPAPVPARRPSLRSLRIGGGVAAIAIGVTCVISLSLVSCRADDAHAAPRAVDPVGATQGPSPTTPADVAARDAATTTPTITPGPPAPTTTPAPAADPTTAPDFLTRLASRFTAPVDITRST